MIMYANSAYLHKIESGFVDETKPLLITCCGTYHLHTVPHFRTTRPNGRSDFQLLYVASGKVYFYLDEKEYIAQTGNMILYQPYEEQNYVYYSTDKTEVYWIHFTGNDVENILSSYDIPLEKHTFYIGTSIIYETLFKEIMKEIQNQNLGFEEMTVSYFRQLLLFSQRNRIEHQHCSNHSMMQEVELAKNYFHDHYQESISIEDYAHSKNISTCWFIRSFRTLTGSTPLQYIHTIRMNNAKTLLEYTQYNITEVAALVGFDDPLHFSHRFKKHTGVSPSEYRKRI